MHPQQQEFCMKVRATMPEHFTGVRVVDFGSLDINGNNRYLFVDSTYLGIDIGEGDNVDLVCRAHEFAPGEAFDVVVSTEMLEHDEYWQQSLLNAYSVLKPGGLLLFTCACDPRPEHGTKRTSSEDAPFVGDYYRNLSPADVQATFDLEKAFDTYTLQVQRNPGDLYFAGVKQ